MTIVLGELPVTPEMGFQLRLLRFLGLGMLLLTLQLARLILVRLPPPPPPPLMLLVMWLLLLAIPIYLTRSSTSLGRGRILAGESRGREVAELDGVIFNTIENLERKFLNLKRYFTALNDSFFSSEKSRSISDNPPPFSLAFSSCSLLDSSAESFFYSASIAINAFMFNGLPMLAEDEGPFDISLVLNENLFI